MSTPQVAERTRKPLGWKRIVGYVISLVIVVAHLLVGDPEVRGLPGRLGGDQDAHADRDVVARRRDDLQPRERTGGRTRRPCPASASARPRSLTQTTTSVANTLPAGGAIAVGLTYSILDSWGFSGTSVALYVGVTGIWNIFTKLALADVGARVPRAQRSSDDHLHLGGDPRSSSVLSVAVGLVRRAVPGRRCSRSGSGNWLGRVMSWFRRLFHKPPVTTWGDGAARFRRDTIVLVGTPVDQADLDDGAQPGRAVLGLAALAAGPSVSPSRKSPPPRRSRCTHSHGSSRRCRSPLEASG